MLLKGSRFHTSNNAQFTSSRLVLYISLAPILPNLTNEIEEESALDATSTRDAPGLFRSDGIQFRGRAYPSPIRVTKRGFCIPLSDSADS
jgi:hypothetical protein